MPSSWFARAHHLHGRPPTATEDGPLLELLAQPRAWTTHSAAQPGPRTWSGLRCLRAESRFALRSAVVAFPNAEGCLAQRWRPQVGQGCRRGRLRSCKVAPATACASAERNWDHAQAQNCAASAAGCLPPPHVQDGKSGVPGRLGDLPTHRAHGWRRVGSMAPCGCPLLHEAAAAAGCRRLPPWQKPPAPALTRPPSDGRSQGGERDDNDGERDAGPHDRRSTAAAAAAAGGRHGALAVRGGSGAVPRPCVPHRGGRAADARGPVPLPALLHRWLAGT